MPEITTPDATPEPGTQDNWEARYKGLQKVLAERDTTLTTSTAALDSLRQEHEQTLAELDTYRQRDVDASEEEQARKTYEDLRARFEPEPPPPVGLKGRRGWEDGSESGYLTRDKTGSTGFPT